MDSKKCIGCGLIYFNTNSSRPCRWNVRKFCSDSCHNKQKEDVDITGIKFNRLEAIKFSHRTGDIRQYHYFWTFRCDCGAYKEIDKSSVKSGHTKSCGCLNKETSPNFKHGFRRTSFYNRFCSIKARCNNKNSNSFKDYGGRGIKCRWEAFEEFRDDMYDSFLEHVSVFGLKETSIDRIDVNGDYCKENCRWSTILEQANNKRPIVKRSI